MRKGLEDELHSLEQDVIAEAPAKGAASKKTDSKEQRKQAQKTEKAQQQAARKARSEEIKRDKAKLRCPSQRCNHTHFVTGSSIRSSGVAAYRADLHTAIVTNNQQAARSMTERGLFREDFVGALGSCCDAQNASVLTVLLSQPVILDRNVDVSRLLHATERSLEVSNETKKGPADRPQSLLERAIRAVQSSASCVKVLLNYATDITLSAPEVGAAIEMLGASSVDDASRTDAQLESLQLVVEACNDSLALAAAAHKNIDALQKNNTVLLLIIRRLSLLHTEDTSPDVILAPFGLGLWHFACARGRAPAIKQIALNLGREAKCRVEGDAFGRTGLMIAVQLKKRNSSRLWSQKSSLATMSSYLTQQGILQRTGELHLS